MKLRDFLLDLRDDPSLAISRNFKDDYEVMQQVDEWLRLCGLEEKKTRHYPTVRCINDYEYEEVSSDE